MDSVYVRMPGMPIPAGYEDIFTNNSVINITQPVNMSYPVYVKGLEFEWQTNFWYLPKPFSYFSLYTNYILIVHQQSTRHIQLWMNKLEQQAEGRQSTD